MSLTKATYSMISGAVINVLDYGADPTGTNDSSAAIQAAIDAANGQDVFLPKGTYKLLSTIKFVPTTETFEKPTRLIGAGMLSTVLDTRVANGYAIEIAGTAVSKWSTGSLVEALSIRDLSGSTVVANGIKVSGVFNLDINQIFVYQLSGTGLVFTSSFPPDLDTSAFVRVTQSFFRACGIYGIAVSGASASVTLVYADISHCSIDQNGHGGLYMSGIDQVTVRYCTITINGAVGNLGGITLADNGAANKNIIIEANEIGNNNKPYNLAINRSINCQSILNRYITNNGETNTLDNIFLVDNCSGFVSNSDLFSAGPSITPIFGIRSSSTGPITSGVTVLNPYWFIWGASGQTKYSFSAFTKNVYISDQNQSRGNAYQYSTATVSTGSYTPDPLESTYHRIVVSATGAFTVNAPTRGESGMELMLDIVNASSGVITITLASGIGGFEAATFTNPSAGQRITARFIYDPNATRYIQCGGWATV